MIECYVIDKEVGDGYEYVYIFVLMNFDVYKMFGYWDYYCEDMFLLMDMGDGELFELWLMNCLFYI